jgi:hypothetical protein
MRSTQFRDVTVEELEATWAHADNTPRVDVSRMNKNLAAALGQAEQRRRQPPTVNHIARYRAARKAKLATQVT